MMGAHGSVAKVEVLKKVSGQKEVVFITRGTPSLAQGSTDSIGAAPMDARELARTHTVRESAVPGTYAERARARIERGSFLREHAHTHTVRARAESEREREREREKRVH